MNKKAKELLLQQQQDEELRMGRNTFNCSNFLMQRMGLDVDPQGYIKRIDDDTNEVSEFIFDGKKCKDLNFAFDMRNELPFDPYNNAKLCCGILQYYINDYLNRDTNMIFLTNKSMNESGQATVMFDSGEKVVGNVYNKDTLKYIDMILVLDGALPFDFARLREMDI